jgi:hypothetical protein
MRAAVTAAEAKLLILGPYDNGFPWGTQWRGGYTDAKITAYYETSVVQTFDVAGADFYDGVSDSNEGEPAWKKMDNFRKYWDGRGFEGVNDPGWKYDAGEFQIYLPKDMDDLVKFLQTPAGKDFNALCIFNSGANNRPDLPSDLNGSWVLKGQRLAAFQRALDTLKVKRVS